MTNYGTVTIYMQVYNTKEYLEQCLNSVLSQTYTDWEFILVDNGCTDGSSEILKKFADQNSRVHLIRFKENQQGFWRQLINQYSTGSYFTLIDSDDWWEPDYLDRLVKLAQENKLDIVCTGCVMHFAATKKQGLRQIEHPLFLSKNQFPDALPLYHQFFRTTWGKLICMDIFKTVTPREVPTMVYGGDTADCFRILRHSKKIGVDNSALYHYRIHSKSTSYQYNSKRFEADVYLYNDLSDFLISFGPISPQNYSFSQCVYCNAITDTTNVIYNSSLSSIEKLREYHTIAAHPVTQAVYHECKDESADQSRKQLIQFVMLAGEKLGGQDNTDFHDTMHLLLPFCGGTVTGQNFSLFLRETSLYDALQRDDWEVLVCRLMELIVQKRYSKQYNLGQMLGSLIPSKTLLEGVTDTRFFREYADICMLILSENYSAALEQMTGLLLEEKKLYAAERFLGLYLSLAALEEQPPAFLFGKIKLAWIYLRQNRLEECRAVADELVEIGLGNEEIDKLYQALEKA